MKLWKKCIALTIYKKKKKSFVFVKYKKKREWKQQIHALARPKKEETKLIC